MLFDKHNKPVLTGCDEEADWAACEEFEDYVYNTGWDEDLVSEDEWDRRISDVAALYAEYYAYYG